MDKRTQSVQSMFSKISTSYDCVNTVLSFGIHHLWKQKLVKMTDIKVGSSVLDCATGTGDLALLYKAKVGNQGQVIASDFCRKMLLLAPEKAKRKNLDIRFDLADVTKLPYKDNSFDATSISFGIRNVENLPKTFGELARVTRPEGQVMILEFGQVQVPVIKQIYNFYSKRVLPFIGGVISGNFKAYQYLNDSSRVFPCGEDFKKRILSTGFYKDVTVIPLSFGVAFIYKCLVKCTDPV